MGFVWSSWAACSAPGVLGTGNKVWMGTCFKSGNPGESGNRGRGDVLYESVLQGGLRSVVVCKNKASLLGCEDRMQLPARHFWRCCHRQSCAVGCRPGEQRVPGVAASPRAPNEPSPCRQRVRFPAVPGSDEAGLLEGAVSKQLGSGCWPWYLAVAGASKMRCRRSEANFVLRMTAVTDLRCLKLLHRVCCWGS